MLDENEDIEVVIAFHEDIKDYGTTHNPLYDCEVAYKVYRNLVKDRETTVMLVV